MKATDAHREMKLRPANKYGEIFRYLSVCSEYDEFSLCGDWPGVEDAAKKKRIAMYKDESK